MLYLCILISSAAALSHRAVTVFVSHTERRLRLKALLQFAHLASAQTRGEPRYLHSGNGAVPNPFVMTHFSPCRRRTYLGLFIYLFHIGDGVRTGLGGVRVASQERETHVFVFQELSVALVLWFVCVLKRPCLKAWISSGVYSAPTASSAI